jgi:hypothetical protein
MTTMWTTGSTEYTGIKLNVSDISSSITSKIIDLQINSASLLTVTKLGQMAITGITGSILGTSSNSINSETASYADVANTAINTTSASYASIADNAINCPYYLPLAGGMMSGPLNLNSDPTSFQQAATKNYVDNKVPVNAVSSSYSNTASLAVTALNSNTASVAPNYVQLSGSTMSGYLTLNGNPISASHAATKNYVDSVAGILTPSSSISSSYAVTSSYSNTAKLAPDYVLLSGSTMVGYLVLNGNPLSSSHAATKNYVDTFIPSQSLSSSIANLAINAHSASVAASYLLLAGGQMVGHIKLYSDPIDPDHPATKNYVDNFTPSASISASYIATASSAYKLLITGSSYANNETALSGGLNVGDFYRTGGDPDYICVVH